MSAARILKYAVLTLAVALFLNTEAHGALAFRNISEGQPAPPFMLKDQDGADVSLGGFLGKVVVVMFFKPDQENSVLAVRDLVKVNQRLAPKGVIIIGVVSETEQANKLKAIIDEEKVNFPVLMDEGRKVYGSWGLFLYPTTGIIDKEGKLALQVPSHNRKFQETVEGECRLLLGEISKEHLEELLNPKEAAKETPEQQKAERHMMLARRLVDRKLYDKAADELKQAIEADPNLLQARLDYGFVLLGKGDSAGAAASFQKASELDPRSADARTGLGASCVASGDVDKGIALLEEAVKDNPKPAMAHYELGKAYEKKAAFDKASEHYRKAYEALGGGK